ncbi:MAG: adenylate kinase [Clostridiaceae bacterium]|nr:adenylate kinase [Clostridiaceae bacterium]
MILILLGAPGAGKGTQADYLKDVLKVPVISTGNLLRGAIAQGNELGDAAKHYMDKGQLVPDDIIVDLVLQELRSDECEKGAILDGFPRTVAQAEALDSHMHVDVALSIEVPDEHIVSRMAGRRTCPKCQSTYHIINHPPRVEGICDKCGTRLEIRKDDAPDIVRQRLVTYHNQTEPVKHYYAAQGNLICMDGVGSVPETRQRALRALEGWI